MYINSLPKEYHRIFWDIMICAEIDKDLQVELDKNKSKLIMRYLFRKDKEIERLNKKIEQYENPEDMTLMFMWCDEKAKDEIKRLNNIINELEEFLIQLNKKIKEITNVPFDVKEIMDELDKIKELKGSVKE